MPADIIGTNIVMELPDGRRVFEFQPGPIFSQIVLADEINRATPKTQSALLEAMQEHSVTVGGTIHTLKEPFFVMATQNPIEQEGTYPAARGAARPVPVQADRRLLDARRAEHDPRPHHPGRAAQGREGDGRPDAAARSRHWSAT